MMCGQGVKTGIVLIKLNMRDYCILVDLSLSKKKQHDIFLVSGNDSKCISYSSLVINLHQ